MQAERETLVNAFLAQCGWGAATRRALVGDASNRRYERLTGGPGGGRAVLMDAPPERGEGVRPFLAIARHLGRIGLSAPGILAANTDQGLLLLEDLGDGLFARLLESDKTREEEFYLAATDVLVHLHRTATPAAPDLGPDVLVGLTDVAYDWYGFGASGARNPAGKTAMQQALTEAFAQLAPWEPVLALRDYHAENLFWLPERHGVARVGLIDFQDAGLGHPAYDLVSLGRDVRRDVSPETFRKMLARYCDATGQDPDSFGAAAAALSVQRTLRILGVFARLSLHFGKAQYVDFIPRTWEILMQDLSHPALTALRDQVCADLPSPTPPILKTLKEKCATLPHP